MKESVQRAWLSWIIDFYIRGINRGDQHLVPGHVSLRERVETKEHAMVLLGHSSVNLSGKYLPEFEPNLLNLKIVYVTESNHARNEFITN